MPIKDQPPKPKIFPCKIGIDFWMKVYQKPKDKNEKHKRPSQVFYKYTDARMDEDGWIDPIKWLPYPYDLCWLKTMGKTRTGWWTDKNWEGARLKPEEAVFYWKKCNEEMS